jgi:uncharacterized protein DUF4406
MLITPLTPEQRTLRHDAIDAFRAAERTLGGADFDHVEDLNYESSRYRDCYVSSVDSIVSDRKATYLSTPVTGGLAQFEFLKKHGLKSREDMNPNQHKEFASEVVAKNLEDAAEAANNVRVANNEFVINPGRLGAMKSWKQGDYMSLWLKTMDDVDVVTMRDGWELSTGCVLEARKGFDLGVPVRTQSGEILSQDQALLIVEKGERKVRNMGFESPDHVKILADPDFQPDQYLRTVG